jgi:hypothetical protein
MHFYSASALGEKIEPKAGLDNNEIMMEMIHGKAVSSTRRCNGNN